MLTEEQKLHNLRLDYEIAQAEREFQQREEQARLKNEWFRQTYPDAPEETKATYGINVIGRRCVVGLRYVE